MNKIIFKKVVIDKTNILLLILNLLFVIYYALLAFYSRPHYDDLHFLWKLKESSIGEFINYIYMSRSGRFADYFIDGVVFKTILLIGNFRLFPLISGFIGAIMCFYSVKLWVKDVSPYLIFNIVLFFFNLSVLTNIDFAVFNWLCAMSFYWLAPALLLTIAMINKEKLTIFQWIVLFLLSVFLGGGQEAFTPVVLAILFFNGLIYFKTNNYKVSDTIQDTRIQKIIVSAVVMLICFVVLLVAPGNYSRLNSSEFVSPSNLSGFIFGFAKALGMFYYFLSFYAFYYLILALLFIQLGGRARITDYKLKYSYKRLSFYSLLIYAVYILLSVFPSVYLWSGFGIQRNYTHVVFFTIFFISFEVFLFGYFKTKMGNGKYVGFFLNFGLLIMSCIMIANIYTDTISARKYAQSVDVRIETLQKLNREGVTGIVSVDPVSPPYTTDPKYLLFKLLGKENNPQPILYYISDTDEEPNEYAFHLQKVYGFNFLIKLKNKVEQKKD